MEEVYRCSRCATLLNKNMFYSSNHRKNGIQSECKQCYINRQQKKRDAQRLVQRVGKYEINMKMLNYTKGRENGHLSTVSEGERRGESGQQEFGGDSSFSL